MFGIDAKEIFEEKMSDIVSILFAVYILVVAVNYVIKWIRPYLKNDTSSRNKQKPKYTSPFGNKSQNIKKSTDFCSQCENEITDEEYISIFEKLKTFIDSNSSKALLDSSSLMKINMMSDSEFENALHLGNFIRRVNKSKCSSEAQTNITINPELKVDYSYPELILINRIPDETIKKSESSDSFQSLSSKKSSTDIAMELEKIINELEGNDDGQRQKSAEDITLQKLQKYLNTSIAKSDAVSSFGLSGNRMSHDNKLLEIAIKEFEKELKPIKEQINVLKECITGFDATHNTKSISSDLTSSFSGSGMLSECFSGTLSTACNTDLQSYFSSYHIISAQTFGSALESDAKYKNVNKLDKTVPSHPIKTKHKSNWCNKNCPVVNKGSPKAQEVLKSSERCKLKAKRSPIAEMYVKLSQCDSQSSCLLKNKKEKILTSNNTVTYRIDLNVNLASAPVTNSYKPKLGRERAILPLTADPEDILGKLSNTHISLIR